jgi:hypothetical protein
LLYLLIGKKTVLVSRILAYDLNESVPTSISTVLLKSWFMSPQQQTEYTITGSLNERKIVKKLAYYLNKHAKIKIETIGDYGLLCKSHDRFYAAFSPDGIVVAKSDEFGSMVALLELKTRVTQGTEFKEREILAEHGAFAFVELSDEDGPSSFEQLIPDVNHRCQLLHGMSCSNLHYAFYVVASTTSIIRVVLVQSSEYDLLQYQDALDEQYEEGGLRWILEGKVPDDLQLQSVPYAVDDTTVLRTLQLWNAVNDMIIMRGSPLPHGKMLIPSIIAMWNRCKGPIDVYSRFLKNVHVQHFKLSPLGAVWLRIIMSCVYNAYQTNCLISSHQFLVSPECNSYTAYQQYKKKNNSFSHFCYLLARDLRLKLRDDSPRGDSTTTTFEDSDDNDNDFNNTNIVVKEILYNKRSNYFKKPDLIAKRMNPDLGHVAIKITDEANEVIQQHCGWCCSFKHHEKVPKGSHSRQGCKTTTKCNVCNVPLCTVKRYNDATCFQMWHAKHFPINACNPQVAASMNVRKHSNRKEPPNRRACLPANNGDDNTGDDDDNRKVKAKRKKIEPVVSRKKRMTRNSI